MFGKKAETEVVEEVEHELKFKEWFNLKGIRAEIKNIHWLTKKELFNNSLTVLVFTFVMGATAASCLAVGLGFCCKDPTSL